MKITIAHTQEEQQDAAADLAAILHNHTGAKVHKSDRHPPFKHIYITTKKPEKPHSRKKSACTIPPGVV